MELVPAGELLPEVPVLPFDLLPLQDPLHEEGGLLRVEGLDDVVERPLLHGLHRRVDRRVGGDDDDLRVGTQSLHLGEDVEAVQIAGHLQVDEADGELRLPHRVQSGSTVLRDGDLVPVLPEPGGEGLAHRRLVVHHEDPHAVSHHSSVSRSRTMKVDPTPTSLATAIVPPWDSTIP